MARATKGQNTLAPTYIHTLYVHEWVAFLVAYGTSLHLTPMHSGFE